MNNQYLKHVGYTDLSGGIEANLTAFFSLDTAKFIAAKVSELLSEFYPPGVIIPINRVIEVMNSVYDAFRPATGSIYTRYTMTSNENDNCIDQMINQTIQIITNDVKNNLTQEQTNSRLSVWSSVLGTFNKEGLQSHSQIKLRNRRPQAMQFNMNY